MSPRGLVVVLLVLPSLAVFAEPPHSSPPPRPAPPPPPPPAYRAPIYNPAPSVLPRQPSAWDRIQGPLDRSTGRIVDEPSYQLDQLDRDRLDRQAGVTPAKREFNRFEDERERRLRLEERARFWQHASERERRMALDRDEYELYLNSDFEPVTSQAYADEQALMQAKQLRDQRIVAAQDARADALRADSVNADAVEQAYQTAVNQARDDYESARERILGYVLPPTTAPAATQSGNRAVAPRSAQ